MDKQQLIDERTLFDLELIAKQDENNVTRYSLSLSPTEAKYFKGLLEQEQIDKEKIINEFQEEIAGKMTDLPDDIYEIVTDNFWKLINP